MKSFKSHKVVEAAQILSVAYAMHTDGATLTFEGGESHSVGAHYIERHSPTGKMEGLIGGYYVRYPGDGGYESWSPAVAFEEGYSEHSLDPKDGALPVAGYKPQTSAKVTIVNSFKEAEERVLRRLDEVAKNAPPGQVDQRWYAVGRTHIEQGFMAINRAIFQPGRAALPEDPAPAEA